ncbi:hypothetical protein V1J52_14780 [Streptomyces sp. TRM 70351]|uniref:hypothetical protein n=1 Tax=Streptomyces sp. TRM 70351 TaxID=3116552 RepID=UPI002E7B6764|nr:hypothetical protein [Streptomyces sp. TRM 70351]MEE1929432.1 hypothetical protein [Streptomyces sp. TRM 70351]
MYGTGGYPTPPPRRTGPGGKAMTVRLLFASFPVWSLGLLAWVPSLRFALLRRRPLDWTVFGAFAVGVVLEILLLEFTPEESSDSTASAMAGLYLVAFIGGATAHAIVADRFPRPVPVPPPYGYGYPQPGPPSGPHIAPPATGYGYPQAAAPAPPAPPPGLHQHPTVHAGPAPHVPAAPPPGPPGPAPQPEPRDRMRQVASELDELDQLLRKREGR